MIVLLKYFHEGNVSVAFETVLNIIDLVTDILRSCGDYLCLAYYIVDGVISNIGKYIRNMSNELDLSVLPLQ